MKHLVWIILFSLVLTESYGQSQSRKLRATAYADNIIKVTMSVPRTGWRNEQLSDAVILKPSARKPAVDYLFKDNSISVRNVEISIFDSAEFAGFSIALQPNEKIFGGGERALPLNRRGYRFNLYNNPWYGYSEGADNLNYSVPFFTSSAGYGLFFDNPSKGFVDIGKTNPNIFEYGATSGELNVYIIFGDYKTILQSYHQLTGTQPLPPRWALGNLMSRFGYTSERQVKDIYQKMKNAGVPVDAVIFDLFWFGDSIKGTMGNLDWVNRNAWPNPRKMITDYKKEGVQTILVTEPFLWKQQRITPHQNLTWLLIPFAGRTISRIFILAKVASSTSFERMRKAGSGNSTESKCRWVWKPGGVT